MSCAYPLGEIQFRNVGSVYIVNCPKADAIRLDTNFKLGKDFNLNAFLIIHARTLIPTHLISKIEGCLKRC